MIDRQNQFFLIVDRLLFTNFTFVNATTFLKCPFQMMTFSRFILYENF